MSSFTRSKSRVTGSELCEARAQTDVVVAGTLKLDRADDRSGLVCLVGVRGCFLVMPADLEWLAWKLGETETLWNRHPNCRRVGCRGVITFNGTPPQTNTCMELKAEWPKEWTNEKPAVPRRRPPETREPPLASPQEPEAARRPWMR